MEQIVSQLKSHILDEVFLCVRFKYFQKYFTARFFSFLSGLTGFSSKHVAIAIAFVVALYLEFGPGAFFVANSLLIAYPTVTTYMYPEERPVRDLLLVYWACFGLLIAFDRFLDFIPLYYNLKICLLALFFLEPFCLAEELFKSIEGMLKDYNLLTSSDLNSGRSCRSSRPEKPLKESKGDTAPSAENIPIPDLTDPKKQSKETLPVTIEPPKELKMAVKESKVEKPLADLTAISSGHGLTANQPITKSGFGIDNKEIGSEANIHDLLLSPKDAVVFNAPFDHENLTYHMKAKNNSKHQMGFAIKGNCIPRVTTSPASGLLTPGEFVTVAITVQKFEYNSMDFNKDRIIFEYVLLKEEQRKFSHKLLQQSDVKRRKNIQIRYNV